MLNMFPYSYKLELDNQLRQQTQQINNERNESISRRNSSGSQSVDFLNRSKNNSAPEYAQFAGGGFIAGLVVGAFVCFTNGDAIDSKINFSSSIGSAIMFWLMFGVIGAILALILCGIISSVQNRSNQNIDNKIVSAKNQTANDISSINAKYDLKIKELTKNNERLYNTYLTNFNNEAQNQSVRFAESPLAVEVINWMTDGFSKLIDSADRRSHVETISIPFVFRTYYNKIECNLGVFDFEIKRCDFLKTPIEQTALTRAIASAIQLNITIKYPKDVSGTGVLTNIDYDYNTDCVIAKIIYSATNGNYKATRGWATE